MRKKNPLSREAGLFDLKAEEEAASARTLSSFIAFAWVEVDSEAKPEDRENQLDKMVAGELRNYGYEALEAPETGGLPVPGWWRRTKDWICGNQEEDTNGKLSMWRGLEEKVCDAQLLVWRLTSSIAVFVGALVLFTFALVNREKPGWLHFLTRLGCLVAVLGILYACGLHPRTWLTFALFSLWLLILPVVGMLCASQTRLETSKTLARIGKGAARCMPEGWWESVLCRIKNWAQRIENRFELRDDDPGKGSRVGEGGIPVAPTVGFDDAFGAHHYFGHCVIVGISITALASALMALAYTTASIHSDRAASKALEKQAEFFRVSTQQRAIAFAEMKDLAAARNYRVRYWAVQQRVALARENPSKADLKEALQQSQSNLEGIEEIEKRDPQIWTTLDGNTGPDGDPYFPQKLLTPKMEEEAYKKFAESDGENEISLALRNRATAYLRAVTLFAIALYLFGQALSLGRTRAAFMLAIYAVALGCGGLWTAVAGVVKNRPPSQKTVREVAEHYARGMAAYEIEDTPRRQRNSAGRGTIGEKLRWPVITTAGPISSWAPRRLRRTSATWISRD